MDIFKRIPGQDPMWMETAEDVEAGIRRMLLLCVTAPDHYFTYDPAETRIVASVSLYRRAAP